MFSGVIEGGISLILGVAGGIFIIGQMNASAKRNAEDIGAIKSLMKDHQDNLRAMIEKNMQDTRILLDTNKEHQREALEREISHIKDLLNVSSAETREDIKRLEAAQKSSNMVKERLALAEASLKSLHKRLDVEPQLVYHDKEEQD